MIGILIAANDMSKGWINRLAVHPNYRKQGIAKILVRESEKILRKHGIRIFCALVVDDNTASQVLFKECVYVKHQNIIYFSKRDSDEF